MFSGWADKISDGLNYLYLPFEFQKYFGQIMQWTFAQRSSPHELIHWKTHKYWLQTGEYKIVIDMGTNTGPFSFAAWVCLPDAQIYAFEPLTDCFNQLIKNLNPFENFTIQQIAIGDQKGQKEMFSNRKEFFTVGGFCDEK